MKTYVSSLGTGAPLSGVVEVNGTVFLSGQIHADKDWNLIGENIEERFDAVMSNIERLLKEAGLNFENIVQVRLYLTDLTELPNLNKVYGNYFKHPIIFREF